MRLSNFLFHSHENSVQLLSHVQLFAILFCPWDSLGKNTGMGSHFLLQGIIN